MAHMKQETYGTGCNVGFTDPTDDIVSGLNSMMFSAGVLAGTWRNATQLIDKSLSVNQTVQVQQTRTQNVFHSDLGWFAGAAAIQTLTILLILPVFWGWWSIGVELTLSPFQTAKMLDAPLLKHINSAAGATGITNEMGDRKLKLGLVGVPEYTPRPKDDEKNLDRAGESYATGSRIGITDAQRVVRPQKGMRFKN